MYDGGSDDTFLPRSLFFVHFSWMWMCWSSDRRNDQLEIKTRVFLSDIADVILLDVIITSILRNGLRYRYSSLLLVVCSLNLDNLFSCKPCAKPKLFISFKSQLLHLCNNLNLILTLTLTLHLTLTLYLTLLLGLGLGLALYLTLR